MRVKICGITQLQQGQDILRLGASDIGFICVHQSPRYISPQGIQAIISVLSQTPIRSSPQGYIGVFVDASLDIIQEIINLTGLTGVQLHGNESPEFCTQLRLRCPKVELIKAFRIRSSDALSQTQMYQDHVDVLLLDAYHPHQWGGTGQVLDWAGLKTFKPSCPWFLAGGLNPDNIVTALQQIQPDGIDLSSGVEDHPGDKNIDKVTHLFEQLREHHYI